MQNIIGRILEIDRIAREKMQAATDRCEAYRAEIETTLADDSAMLEQSANSRMEKVRTYESENAQAQKEEADRMSAEKIAQIDRAVAEHREEWVTQIVSAVLGKEAKTP